MSRALQRLNVLAMWVLGGVLLSVVVVRTWPGGRLLARTGGPEDKWAWPNTLQVYPSQPGDPVKLVGIMLDGKNIVPGKDGIPEIAGDGRQTRDAMRGWLQRASFTLQSQTSKNIVSVGMAVLFPVRSTDIDCNQITGHKSASEPWCDAHPHYCDGGCPGLLETTLHWGQVPEPTASGLDARFARSRAEGAWLMPLKGRGWFKLAPGEEIGLSLAGPFEGMIAGLNPRHPFSDSLDRILFEEGIEQARDTEPCVERKKLKTGCAFVEASKFNIGIDVVYFEDGTIWGNYGFGYALPNPDGIFTRVEPRDFPGILSRTPAPN